MVLEIDLHNFIAKSEHDGMLCSHPFLNINSHSLGYGSSALRTTNFISLLFCVVVLKIRSEMLKESDFFL
jgi:hypothetical protein